MTKKYVCSVNQRSFHFVLVMVKAKALKSKEWPGKIIYLNFDSIFGDFFLKFFEEEVSDYLS